MAALWAWHEPIAISAGDERTVQAPFRSARAAELTDDRLLVDLSDRRAGQRRHRDQHVGPGVRGDTTLVEVCVQFGEADRRAGENNCSANFFAKGGVGAR